MVERIIIIVSLLTLSACQSDSTKIVESIDNLTKAIEKTNAIERERNQLIKDNLKLQEAIHKERLDTSGVYEREFTN